MIQALEPVAKVENDLGEVPIWCPDRRCLFWTDIRACRLMSFDPETAHVERIAVPDWVGCFALTDGEELLVALRKSYGRFDPEDGSYRTIDTFEDGLPTNRSNDGRVDRQGRFWFGTLNNAARDATGSLYCVTNDRIEKRISDIIVPNALGWSPDSRTMYFTDSWVGDVWAFDFDPESAHISNRRIFLPKDAVPGIPDGAAIDAEGCFWQARYGAGLLVRVTPDGRVDTIIECKTKQLTACTFGGGDLRDLYVTSARQRMTEDELAAQPDAGALFRVRVDVGGLSEPRYGTGTD